MKKILLICVSILLMLTPNMGAFADAGAQTAPSTVVIEKTEAGEASALSPLDRAPTRNEAMALLVYLLGKESEALHGTWEMPFTDVADWAKPYVSYAYANGLIPPTDKTVYNGDEIMTTREYLAFLLRVLGYVNDSLTDASRTQVALEDVSSIAGLEAMLQSVWDLKKAETAPSSPTYSIDKTGAIPPETGVRKLSDVQLQELSGYTPEEAAASISTLADAYAWLKQEGYATTGMSIGIKSSTIQNGTTGRELSYIEMSTVLHILLYGDYEDIGTVLIATKSKTKGIPIFYISFVYVRVNGFYYITDPNDHLPQKAFAVYRAHTIIASDLSCVYDALWKFNDTSNLITLATYPLYTDNIRYTFREDPISVTFPTVPGIQYLYQANEESSTPPAEEPKTPEKAESDTEPTKPVQTPTSGPQTYSVDITGAIPPETGARKLSDAQLKKLAGMTPEKAASSITTLADAYAWLKQEGYQTTGMSGNSSGIRNGTTGRELSWVEMSTVIHVLLDGDYEDIGTLLIVTQPAERGWDMFYISFVYVRVNGTYYITDPVDHLENTGWAIYQAHTIIASDLSCVREALGMYNNTSNLVTLATYPLYTKTITVNFREDPMSVTFPKLPGIQYLYQANEKTLAQYEEAQKAAEKAEAERWARVAKDLKVSAFGMPDAIGNTTLDYDEALALVGKDPKEIAKNVHTVGDVLQYMIAARFGYNSPSAYTPWYANWGFDAPGDEQLRQNYGCCCGGYANTVSYLLQGDYDKVGTLRWVGGGNHTISWVYTNEKYYVFDFTQYCNGGNYSNYRAPVTILDDLTDFYDEMPDIYSRYKKDAIVIMVAFETGEAMYPSHWQDPPRFTGLTFPSEAEGNVILIYQRDPKYGVDYKPIQSEIPGWEN